MADERNIGETLDKVLSHVDGLCKRLDALEKANADYDLRNRSDARNRAKADAANIAQGKDAPAPPMLNDPDDPYRRYGDPKQTAADDNKGTQNMADDLPTKIRKAKAMRDELNHLEREVSREMQATAQGPLHEAEEAAMAEMQARADSVYNELGKRAPAPWPGERAPAYRLRLLKPLQGYSEGFKSLDLAAQTPKNIDVFEKQIFSDAIAYADSAERYADNAEPVPIVKTDDSGRRITTFRGKHSFINKFKGETRLATIRDPREFALRELLQKGQVV